MIMDFYQVDYPPIPEITYELAVQRWHVRHKVPARCAPQASVFRRLFIAAIPMVPSALRRAAHAAPCHSFGALAPALCSSVASSQMPLAGGCGSRVLGASALRALRGTTLA